MNQSTHAMLRLLSDDAGLGAPVEARYDPIRRARKSKVSVALATALEMVAVAPSAALNETTTRPKDA